MPNMEAKRRKQKSSTTDKGKKRVNQVRVDNQLSVWSHLLNTKKSKSLQSITLFYFLYLYRYVNDYLMSCQEYIKRDLHKQENEPLFKRFYSMRWY
jgi:hypothetical protein